MLKKLAMGALALLVSILPLSGLTYAATATNLISNPSVETSTNGTAPDNWSYDYWGTSTSTQSYLSTGHTGSHSVQVTTTARTDGAANWYPATAAITGGKTYEYSDWYKSGIATEVDAEVTMSDGTKQSIYIGSVPASTDWAQYKTTYTAPAGATSILIFHLIAGVGTLTTDDYSLSEYTVTGFTAPIVSVTFDDGWKNQMTNAAPIMKQNGLVGTYYIISDVSVTNPDPSYMNSADIKSLYADGNEIGSHTVHHCSLIGSNTDVTTDCPAATNSKFNQQLIVNELKNSQDVLNTLLGGNVVKNFAYPYGENNANSVATAKTYYDSQRTVDRGYNTKDNVGDYTQLKMYEIDSDISVDQVKQWINQAVVDKTWLILCYHEIADAPIVADDALYTAKIADFKTEMEYLASLRTSGSLSVKTVAQALTDVKAQMNTTTPPAVKPGDLNSDNVVDALDLSIVLANWNTTSASSATGDLNGDKAVDALDLSIVLANWSK